MKNIIISIVFAGAILAGACSSSREVRMTERQERDDGTVIKKERRIDDDGVVIKKKKRDNEVLENDEDDRDTEVRIKRNRRDRDRDRDLEDEPAIIIERDRD